MAADALLIFGWLDPWFRTQSTLTADRHVFFSRSHPRLRRQASLAANKDAPLGRLNPGLRRQASLAADALLTFGGLDPWLGVQAIVSPNLVCFQYISKIKESSVRTLLHPAIPNARPTLIILRRMHHSHISSFHGPTS
ncbi:MAG: hypothetical protein EOM25_04880 [Deltaproteobacteria bacterium]|nr:hypothetical protein [Deltaproteobacteria bacterium]